MLAKELMMKNISSQMGYIERELRKGLEELRIDGDTIYVYSGYIYPKVLQHFRNEGFKIQKYSDVEILVKTGGLPLYVFTVNDSIILTSEELKKAGIDQYFN